MLELYDQKRNRINIKEVLKPVISRITVKRDKGAIILLLRGKNFVGKRVFYVIDDTTMIFQSESPNTFVTIFPSSLNIELKQKSVSRKGKRMKIKFKVKKEEELINAVLVISTPRGIVSKEFVVKPK